MELNTLTATSPIDGRYASKTADLRPIFSEFGFNQTPCSGRGSVVSGPYPGTLPSRKCPHLANMQIRILDNIVNNFSIEDAQRVKKIESTTNHDVKAVEYFLKEKVEGSKELNEVNEFIHFACTSEDINNLAHGLMLRESMTQVVLPLMDELIDAITIFAKQHSDQAMLSRTHGQPASPTTIGKEMANFAHST